MCAHEHMFPIPYVALFHPFSKFLSLVTVQTLLGAGDPSEETWGAGLLAGGVSPGMVGSSQEFLGHQHVCDRVVVSNPFLSDDPLDPTG